MAPVKRWISWFIILSLLTALGSCIKEDTPSSENTQNNMSQQSQNQSPKNYGYEVVRTYPHQRDSFTQGLIFHEGFLYEGTGGKGTSHLMRVDLNTGKTLQKISLPPHLWGEGITVFGDRIFQLTWRGRLAYTYNRISLTPLEQFKFQGEGWGLTHNGTHLIMSDGTHRLRFRDPQTFDIIRTVEVFDEDGRRVKHLNELEYIKGKIYANIWLTSQIAIIDPQTGRITAWIHLDGLKANHRNADVLNGIAYDQAQDRLFVTGKWWNALYEIKLVEQH